MRLGREGSRKSFTLFTLLLSSYASLTVKKEDGELCLGRAKLGETLVKVRSGPDIQIGRPTRV